MDFARSPEEIFEIAASGPVTEMFRLRDQGYISDCTLANILLMQGISSESNISNEIVVKCPNKYESNSDNILRVLLTYGSKEVISKILDTVQDLDSWSAPRLPAPMFLHEAEWTEIKNKFPLTSRVYNFSDPDSYTIDYLARLLVFDNKLENKEWQVNNVSKVPISLTWLNKMEDLFLQISIWDAREAFMMKVIIINYIYDDSWLPFLSIYSEKHYPSLLWFILMLTPEILSKLSDQQKDEVYDYLKEGFLNLQKYELDYTACLLLSKLYDEIDLQEQLGLDPDLFEMVVKGIRYTVRSRVEIKNVAYSNNFLTRLSAVQDSSLEILKNNIDEITDNTNLIPLKLKNYEPSIFPKTKINTPRDYFDVLTYIVEYSRGYGFNKYLFREILYLNDINLINLYFYFFPSLSSTLIKQALKFALATDHASILQFLYDQFPDYFIRWDNPHETWIVDNRDISDVTANQTVHNRLEELSRLIEETNDPYLASEVYQMQDFKANTLNALQKSLGWTSISKKDKITPFLINNIINQYIHANDSAPLTKLQINLILKQAISYDKSNQSYVIWYNEYQNDPTNSNIDIYLLEPKPRNTNLQNVIDKIFDLIVDPYTSDDYYYEITRGGSLNYQIMAAHINSRSRDNINGIMISIKPLRYITSSFVQKLKNSYIGRRNFGDIKNIHYLLICLVLYEPDAYYDDFYYQDYLDNLGFIFSIAPGLELTKRYINMMNSFDNPSLNNKINRLTNNELSAFGEYIRLDTYFILQQREELEPVIQLYKSTDYIDESYYDHLCRKIFINNYHMISEILWMLYNLDFQYLDNIIEVFNILANNCKESILSQQYITFTVDNINSLYLRIQNKLDYPSDLTEVETIKVVNNLFSFIWENMALIIRDDDLILSRPPFGPIVDLNNTLLNGLRTKLKFMLDSNFPLDLFNGFFLPIKHLLSVMFEDQRKYFTTMFSLRVFLYLRGNISYIKRLYQNLFDPQLIDWNVIRQKSPRIESNLKKVLVDLQLI